MPVSQPGWRARAAARRAARGRGVVKASSGRGPSSSSRSSLGAAGLPPGWPAAWPAAGWPASGPVGWGRRRPAGWCQGAGRAGQPGRRRRARWRGPRARLRRARRPGSAGGSRRPGWLAAVAGVRRPVAVGGSAGGEVAGEPAGGGAAGAGGVHQLIQGQVQLHLRRLPGPLRQAPRGEQQPHRLFQGVVVALPGGPVILRAGLLPQRAQHLGDRGQALGGQVTVGLAVALEQPGQPEEPVVEAGIILVVGVGRGDVRVDLLSQPGQAVQVQAPGGLAGQERIRAVPVGDRHHVRPAADLPGIGLGDAPGRQRVRDRGMGRQAAHPPDRPRRRPGRHPRLPGQPRMRAAVTVIGVSRPGR